MNDLEPSDWSSVHLRFGGAGIYGEEADRLLLDLVAPAVDAWTERGWIDGWFVVRYQSVEEGSHLRLRLRRTRRGDGPGLRSQVASLGDAPSVRSVAWVAFEPELERYGGPAGARCAEEVFVASSRAAVELLRKVRDGDRSARLGKALLGQLVLLHAFDSDRQRAAALALRFGEATTRLRAADAARWIDEHRRGFDRQADRLAPYVEAAWTALEAGEALTPELDRFRAALVPARNALARAAAAGTLDFPGDGAVDWTRAVERLLPTHLHMLNNRLGVDLREECYLATVVSSTLDQRPAASQAQTDSRFEPAGSAGVP